MQSKNCLSFLDVLVDKSGLNLLTSTFCKPTHTGQYTKWNSFVTQRFKMNLIVAIGFLVYTKLFAMNLNKLKLCCQEMDVKNTF